MTPWMHIEAAHVALMSGSERAAVWHMRKALYKLQERKARVWAFVGRLFGVLAVFAGLFGVFALVGLIFERCGL